MDTASAVGIVVVGVGALAGIITPILKLNGSIVKLTARIDQLIEDMSRNEQRITKHGQEIEQVRAQVQGHEYRLTTVEKQLEEIHK